MWNILEPADEKGKELFNKVVESVKNNPRILWYPSAGNDYRDILELSDISGNITDENQIRGNVNIAYDYDIKKEELPNLFIHNDYNRRVVKLKKGVVFDDGKTRVRINGLCRLKIKENVDINYCVDERYAVAPEEYAYKKPVIYLLDVELLSDELGKINKPVIYFMFENINFLQEVLLKHRITVSYIVKVNDGYHSHGGNRISMSVAYPFLSVLNTKYLIADNHVPFHTRDEVRLFDEQMRRLKEKLNPSFIPPELICSEDLAQNIADTYALRSEWRSYTLEEVKLRPKRKGKVTIPIKWSGRRVNVFRVKIRKEKFDMDKFIDEIIKPFEKD
ncbi:MAG: hypothetical protein ABIJ93_00340 [candidate division WOR-3 bacterium]